MTDGISHLSPGRIVLLMAICLGAILSTFGLIRSGDSPDATKPVLPDTDTRDAKAQFEIGLALAKGDGIQRDDARAVHWLRLSAEQGFAPAQNQLGWMFENGRGVEASEAMAARWYRLAAKSGNSAGSNNLDYLYSQGRVIHEDVSEAREWYRKRNFR